MPSLARRHHFLPQGYLAGFTSTGRKDGWLHALDLATKRSFRTTPLNVAVEKDFKRLDLDGRSPDAVEAALAPFEDRAIQAIRRVLETGRFPDEEDHNWILNLISLLIAQNPKARRRLNHVRTQEAERKLELLVSSPAAWHRYTNLARKAGESLRGDVDYAKALHFVRERRYRVEFSTEGTLRAEFDAQDKVLTSLGKRTWSVLVAPESGPFFISSDYPFSVVMQPGIRGEPGMNSPNTEFLFPLGKRAAFIGVHDSRHQPVIQLSPQAVAMMNTRTARQADRRLFLSEPRFFVYTRGKLQEVQV